MGLDRTTPRAPACRPEQIARKINAALALVQFQPSFPISTRLLRESSRNYVSKKTLGRWGVRSSRLHCARHTWATLALQAGKSIRWVADQLARADPASTLRFYAHATREKEADLSFADFAVRGAPNGPIRPVTKTGPATTSPTA
jgi:integrase